MNEFENETFEAELKNLSPARVPQRFMDRLTNAVVHKQKLSESVPGMRLLQPQLSVSRLLKWLVPITASAVVLIGLLLHRPHESAPKLNVQSVPVPADSGMTANDVEISEKWLGSFDTVTELPTGEPVRFRCSGWIDNVVLRDSAHDILIEQQVPRVTVVPIAVEIY